MVTHNLGYTKWASRIIKLQDGRIVSFTGDGEQCVPVTGNEPPGTRKASGEHGTEGTAQLRKAAATAI
jgi:hypothetical protein